MFIKKNTIMKKKVKNAAALILAIAVVCLSIHNLMVIVQALTSAGLSAAEIYDAAHTAWLWNLLMVIPVAAAIILCEAGIRIKIRSIRWGMILGMVSVAFFGVVLVWASWNNDKVFDAVGWCIVAQCCIYITPFLARGFISFAEEKVGIKPSA